MTFREFQKINTERCEEWHSIDGWSLSDWAVAMAGECGEACNVVKKLNRKRDSIENQDASDSWLREQLADEIADTVTYAFLLAERAGLYMDDIVIRKFNRVSEKHGFPQELPPEPKLMNKTGFEIQDDKINVKLNKIIRKLEVLGKE